MGIRANTGLAEIEVNDNGDIISFAVSDNDFLKKFFDFVEWFSKAGEEIEKIKNAADEKEDDFEKLKSTLEQQRNLSNQGLEKLEEMFGEGTCRKIFGDVSPSFICVSDIIAQLSDEVSNIVEKHNKYFMDKYSSKRKGARK